MGLKTDAIGPIAQDMGACRANNGARRCSERDAAFFELFGDAALTKNAGSPWLKGNDETETIGEVVGHAASISHPGAQPMAAKMAVDGLEAVIEPRAAPQGNGVRRAEAHSGAGPAWPDAPIRIDRDDFGMPGGGKRASVPAGDNRIGFPIGIDPQFEMRRPPGGARAAGEPGAATPFMSVAPSRADLPELGKPSLAERNPLGPTVEYMPSGRAGPQPPEPVAAPLHGARELPGTTTTDSSPARQIVAAIAGAAAQVKDELKASGPVWQTRTIRIQLQPESLGRLHVTLRIKGSAMTMRIAADSDAAATGLNRDRSLLVRLVNDLGFELPPADVAIAVRASAPAQPAADAHFSGVPIGGDVTGDGERHRHDPAGQRTFQPGRNSGNGRTVDEHPPMDTADRVRARSIYL
jgi:hypothetical protein